MEYSARCHNQFYFRISSNRILEHGSHAHTRLDFVLDSVSCLGEPLQRIQSSNYINHEEDENEGRIINPRAAKVKTKSLCTGEIKLVHIASITNKKIKKRQFNDTLYSEFTSTKMDEWCNCIVLRQYIIVMHII